jgi:trimethylguanosine synthase
MHFVGLGEMLLLLQRHAREVSRNFTLTGLLRLVNRVYILVIALDTSPTRLALARHNAQIYGVADRIEFILADYISFAEAYSSHNKTERVTHSTRKIDVIFLSPPWGGPSYLSGSSDDIAAQKIAAETEPEHPSYSLSSIQPIHGAPLFDLTRKITKNVAYYLPRNTRLDEISSLLSEKRQRTEGSMNDIDLKEKVEVEEEWMGNKLKALTCYFGGLAVGQEDMF